LEEAVLLENRHPKKEVANESRLDREEERPSEAAARLNREGSRSPPGFHCCQEAEEEAGNHRPREAGERN
jgi:hypothetical protein